MKERYRVRPLNDRREIEVAVDADSAEEARMTARPSLKASGVSDDDPLIVNRERPIRGEKYVE